MLERICRLSHRIFLGFPESIRMRSVDGYLAESISVVIITIWLRVMAEIVF